VARDAQVIRVQRIGFDLGRFGIQIVASPRHADGLLVTGPVTWNMALALEKTYAAVPAPCLVVAVGACAISGRPYAGLPYQNNGVPPAIPVDIYIPGCPAHPITILDEFLRLLSKIA
jgi:Ni,Fe-hydrogenase III small subunit